MPYVLKHAAFFVDSMPDERYYFVGLVGVCGKTVNHWKFQYTSNKRGGHITDNTQILEIKMMKMSYAT